MRILVTGGAGFIGSAFVRHCSCASKATRCSTSTSSPMRPASTPWRRWPRARATAFCSADICDASAMATAFAAFAPDAVVHLAAESHVDRSIDGPGAFVQTNVVGTFVMLRRGAGATGVPCRRAARRLPLPPRLDRRGLWLARRRRAFHRDDALRSRTRPMPRARPRPIIWCAPGTSTYGLPVLVTNCSNNYGPYQFPEKLIPLIIIKALGRASRCRSTARARTSATGSMSRTTPARILAGRSTRGRVGRELQYRRRQRADEPRGGRDHLRRCSTGCARSQACRRASG